jgi:hypothetical protein
MVAHHRRKNRGRMRRGCCEIHPTARSIVLDEHGRRQPGWADFIPLPQPCQDGFQRGLRPSTRHDEPRHVMVDRDADRPVSSTRIRAAPLDHLDFLEPCVRAHYVKRVVVIGPNQQARPRWRASGRALDTWVPGFGREALGETRGADPRRSAALLVPDEFRRSPPSSRQERTAARRRPPPVRGHQRFCHRLAQQATRPSLSTPSAPATGGSTSSRARWLSRTGSDGEHIRRMDGPALGGSCEVRLGGADKRGAEGELERR